MYHQIVPYIYELNSSDRITSLLAHIESSFIATFFVSLLAPLSGISATVIYKETILRQKLTSKIGKTSVSTASTVVQDYNATDLLVKQTLKQVKPKFCSSCGKTVEMDDGQYCAKCGADLNIQ